MHGPQTTDAARRKRLGAWYTPNDLVDHVVARALDGVAVERPFTVLDPACGDGAFLAGVRRMLGDAAVLTGVDVDASAVAAAAATVPGAELVHADALRFDWGARTFDLVVGNPPFLNQMAAATTRGGRSRFGGGPYADAAAEFLAMAMSLARPAGGRVAMVLPQSLLSTRDAGPIRRAVDEQAALRHVWWSPTSMFDAAVRTCALVFERGGAATPVARTMGPLFEPVASIAPPAGAVWASLLVDGPPVGDGDGPVLGDVAAFTVDFRDQYYGLVAAVGDDVDGPPLVTSGLIEPGRCLWGERPVRFAKQRFERPRVQLDLLSPKLQRWAELRLVPKVLIANQTPTIEAVVDERGEWLPSVPVLSCTAPDLDRVMAVLSSPAATAWVRHHAAGSGLSATSMRLTPALLASIPLP